MCRLQVYVIIFKGWITNDKHTSNIVRLKTDKPTQKKHIHVLHTQSKLHNLNEREKNEKFESSHSCVKRTHTENQHTFRDQWPFFLSFDIIHNNANQTLFSWLLIYNKLTLPAFETYSCKAKKSKPFFLLLNVLLNKLISHSWKKNVVKRFHRNGVSLEHF